MFVCFILLQLSETHCTAWTI